MNNNYSSLINVRNVGLVTIFFAATATYVVLRTPTKTKISKYKISAKRNLKQLKQNEIDKLQKDLQQRRSKILTEFEHSRHTKIPTEMKNTLDFIINHLSPDLYPPKIRLLASQIIQDYAIMYTNINNLEPEKFIIDLAKKWLYFDASNDVHLQIEQINHRYALALRSRSIKEFKELYKWLSNLNPIIREQENIRQNWILRNFQCCSLLGLWEKCQSFGRELEKIAPESLTNQQGQQQNNNNNNNHNNNNNPSQAPLHPLHLFEYIALKLPNQSANFTQVYYNIDKYIKRFDPRLCPPLKFTEWEIKDCSTKIVNGFSTNPKRNQELLHQIHNTKNFTKVNNNSKFMFVYGCLVQFPCFWVQLPASNNKIQPVVLTGPWNDTEMELTASYIRRMPSHPSVNGYEDKKGKIEVIRSDLRLKLDRKLPNKLVKNDKNDDIEKEEKEVDDNNNNNKKKVLSKTMSNGWNWSGEFEHEEGLIECYEKDLNDFKFRRDRNWKMNALKFTCRTWKCDMVICTPD